MTNEVSEDPDTAPDTRAYGQKFGELDLSPDVLEAIEKDLGFEKPSPIQQEAIPILAQGRDLIGKAETGTGKTLAFCAPLLGSLDPSRGAVQGLILCPTRELAQQVDECAAIVGNRRGLKTALLVGGVHQSEQILRLRGGAQVVVATPGRVLDFLRDGRLRLGCVSFVVLDEADRMLDMGFIDDVSEILRATPPERQTAMFSATVPPRLAHLTKRFMRDPLTVSTVQGLATVPDIRQRSVELHSGDKEGFILDLLDDHPNDTCIIFCNTRKDVIELDRTLWGLGYDAGSLHGEHEQERRFKVLEAFKSKQIKTLVATDVAARGLDIDEVTRVINFDVPDEVETYVHRIGRTGRAGGAGESITLVSGGEREIWDRIRRSTKFDIEPMTGWSPTRPRKKVEENRRKDHATRHLTEAWRNAASVDPEVPAHEERRGLRVASDTRRGGRRGESPRRGEGGRRNDRKEERGRSGSARAKEKPPKPAETESWTWTTSDFGLDPEIRADFAKGGRSREDSASTRSADASESPRGGRRGDSRRRGSGGSRPRKPREVPAKEVGAPRRSEAPASESRSSSDDAPAAKKKRRRRGRRGRPEGTPSERGAAEQAASGAAPTRESGSRRPRGDSQRKAETAADPSRRIRSGSKRRGGSSKRGDSAAATGGETPSERNPYAAGLGDSASTRDPGAGTGSTDGAPRKRRRRRRGGGSGGTGGGAE